MSKSRRRFCARQVTTVSPPMQLPVSVHETSAFQESPSSCRLLASSTIRAIAQAYSIDSRTIRSGELFFAVKGEKMDGHDFVQQALEKGAVAAVVRKDQMSRYPAKAGLMAVDDTLVALQTLGSAVRRLWGKPLVGVTGSTGQDNNQRSDRACPLLPLSGAEI